MPSFSRDIPRSLRPIGAAVGLIALLLAGLLTIAPPALAAATFVPLGTADSFAVLAGSGITNTGPTVIVGDIGTYPTTTIVGAAGMTVTGTNHGGDAVTQNAKSDLTTAYIAAAGEIPTLPIVADLGGTTLNTGVYNSGSSIGLTGTLTLDAQGDPDAVFVFQAGSSLITASGSTVSLINGAQACNVFWQVGSSATLGTNSTFSGTLLALTSITATTGSTITGRILARNGAVTLDTNSITTPVCAAAPPTPTATPTATATPTGTPSPAPSTPSTPIGATPTGAPTDADEGDGRGGRRQVPRVPVGAVPAGDGSLRSPR
jgi:hypothetical protein